MPIPVQDTLIEHVGNGVTTVFSYPFTILSSDDLKCRVDGALVTTGFIVSGVGSRTGGSVTFSSAPASLASVLLYRQVSLDRETDYQENGDLLASVIDDDFDRAWMAIQDLGALNERSLRVPVGEVLNELPAEADRDGYLAFAGGVPVLIEAPSASDASALALNLASTSDASKGAAMVGFKQSAPGSVATTVSEKLSEWVSAEQFGARGDGVTDDTNAIQLAISTGKRVELLGKTYIVNGVLTGGAGLKLIGKGKGKTIIKKANGTSGHILDIIGTANKPFIEIKGITFDSNLRDSGVWCEYVSDSVFEGCEFKNHPFWGLVIGVQNGADTVIRNFRNTIKNCTFSNTTATYEHFLLFNAKETRIEKCDFDTAPNGIGIGVYQLTEDTKVKSCSMRDMKTAAYYSLSCNGTTFDGCTVENTTVGIQGANLSDNGAFGASFVYDLKIINCKFKGNTDNGANIGAVVGYVVNGCTFDSNKTIGLRINQGGISVNAQPSNGTISACIFKDNNVDGIGSINAPGIKFEGIGGNQKTIVSGCQFLDTRGTPKQLYPASFTGAFTWSGIKFVGCVMSAYSGATSIGSSGGATITGVTNADCLELT